MADVREATCGDCIHAEICKKLNGGWFSPKNIAYCKAFKDHAKHVEVVRCKDCKHCTEAFDGNPCCGRLRTAFPYVREDDFCSYGERKDK